MLSQFAVCVFSEIRIRLCNLREYFIIEFRKNCVRNSILFSENVQNLLLYIVGAFCYNSFANTHIIIWFLKKYD